MLAAAQVQTDLQRAVAASASRRVAAAWSQLDPADLTGSWVALLPGVTLTVTAAQLLAASAADRYVTDALDEQGVAADPVGLSNPQAFAGVASDGRDLRTLLGEPVIAVKLAIRAGAGVPDALTRGVASLGRIVTTQVADAGRSAERVAIVSRPAVTSYVRVLSLPSCARCVILAGRVYRWSSGFARHPRCDCRHLPTTAAKAPALVADPMAALRSGRVSGLSKADRAAVDAGADLAKVVNTRRGVYVADDGTRFTAEAAGRRRRLMPGSIMRLAGGDRAEAIRLLRLHGYLT